MKIWSLSMSLRFSGLQLSRVQGLLEGLDGAVEVSVLQVQLANAR